LFIFQAGQAQWVNFNFEAYARLMDFRLTVSSSSPGLQFSYPSDREFSSFFWENKLDVGANDYSAVYVDVSSNICGSFSICLVSATYTVSWLNNTQRYNTKASLQGTNFTDSLHCLQNEHSNTHCIYSRGNRL
jgi:hypothetical protein